MSLAVTTIRFHCYQINAEARTTQKRVALRIYVSLGYSLHAGCCFVFMRMVTGDRWYWVLAPIIPGIDNFLALGTKGAVILSLVSI